MAPADYQLFIKRPSGTNKYQIGEQMARDELLTLRILHQTLKLGEFFAKFQLVTRGD